MEISL
jgi:response regulator RpfG family c-di-GMP phosphodiesterase